ncbi:MAG: magnesium-transporting ATPase (P-type) [Halieaceae bacterium]
MSVQAQPALLRILEAGYHCNNARVHGGDTLGDPTEIALRVAGIKAGMTDGAAHRLAEIPFDSSSKYMAVLVRWGSQRRLYVKGAPEIVLPMCNKQLNAAGDCLDLESGAALERGADFAGDALRALCFASKSLSADHSRLAADDLQDLTFLGLQGMIDPPKSSAIEAVAACGRAGIRTIMITGDHPGTAQAIARQLGISADSVLTGVQLSGLSEAQLRTSVERVSVYARVAPEHKKAIAEALKANGHVVAMTGDGVNDAPALKAADIGIAMGISGTEVAKEAADMVLEDDNFATIIVAVEEGRHA